MRFVLRWLWCSWRGHTVLRYQYQEAGLAQNLSYCGRCHLPLGTAAYRLQFPLKR